MKGWATRRRRQEDRREAVNVLIDVHDAINGELVVGERGEPGKYAIGAITLISWRDRLSLALRTLDGQSVADVDCTAAPDDTMLKDGAKLMITGPHGPVSERFMRHHYGASGVKP